jgi:hypothetical protein
MTGLKIKPNPSAITLVGLVKEWRDARQAIFDSTQTNVLLDKQPLWGRLANAEKALMDFAGKLGPDGISLP